ncbi:MAG: diheme cytochrome c [Gammaproteobacteria bacterium]
MQKNVLTTLATSAILLGVVTVLFLPYWGGVSAAAERPDDDHDDELMLPRVMNANWRSECSDCHVAYPPVLLPASSWRALMAGLQDHFGVDASLDTASQAEITDFLVQYAGREPRDRASQPVLRITETSWFRHEHEEELPPSIWQHPLVKSPANCEACHRQAAQGDYDDDTVRVPR